MSSFLGRNKYDHLSVPSRSPFSKPLSGRFMGYILTSLGFFTNARSTTHTSETNGEMMVRNQREELEKKKKPPTRSHACVCLDEIYQATGPIREEQTIFPRLVPGDKKKPGQILGRFPSLFTNSFSHYHMNRHSFIHSSV